jgi:hypothetical protein
MINYISQSTLRAIKGLPYSTRLTVPIRVAVDRLALGEVEAI